MFCVSLVQCSLDSNLWPCPLHLKWTLYQQAIKVVERFQVTYHMGQADHDLYFSKSIKWTNAYHLAYTDLPNKYLVKMCEDLILLSMCW